MKNFLSPENLNLETSQSMKDLIKASSEMDGCPIKNILNNETNSMWLSGEGMPQEITINLKRGILKEYPKKLSAVAIYCWHAYPTNPKLIEIQISKNNENNFNSLGNFELCLKPGTQLFQLDDDNDFLINEKIQKITLKLIIKETFKGDRTYINNVYLYENIDMNFINANNISEDNVNLGNNNNNGLSDSSSIIYLRESRERNLPRSNFSTIGKDKLNNQLKDNLNTFSKDLTEDLLDLKSKDLGLISMNNLNSNPTINLNTINLNNNLTSENNMIISDSELSERKSINKDRILYNNDLNVSSKILEEEEEKEKSSVFNSVKKSNTTSKIFNPIKSQSTNLKNNNIILTSTNNFQGTDTQKEIYKTNEDPINEYIQNENIENYNNNIIYTLQNDFIAYQKYTEEKFKNYDNKISNIENELYEIKDKVNKLAENLSNFIDAQNAQNQSIYAYILEECKHMIDSRIVNAINNLGRISNLNSNNNNYNNTESYYKENDSYISNNLVNNNNENNNNNNNSNYNENNLNQIPTEENNNINNFINISGINSNNNNRLSNIDASKVSEFERKLDFQLEEKFANFSNRLGKKISETILKPSIEKLENMMKGNLNEVKNSLKNVEKRQKQNINIIKKSNNQNRKENISKLLEKLQDENIYNKDYHRKNKSNNNNNKQ